MGVRTMALTIQLIFVIAVAIIVWKILSCIQKKNPFEFDAWLPRKPYVHNQKERAKVIKQNFSVEKIPDNLDAILIGSGIGSLTTAAILSKVGKRVLVLEQHDQAGGTCHTFIDRGYEFDVGIHYVGEMGSQTMTKTLIDQISDGQIEWAPLDDCFDKVRIGSPGKDERTFPIATGYDKWKTLLKKQFPKEHAAIDQYMKLLELGENNNFINSMLKILPLWLVKLILASGTLQFVTNIFRPEYKMTIKELVEGLTMDKDLQTVLLYCWAAYGTPADSTNFTMQAMIQRHFVEEGGYYPVCGGSEIPFNIIPVIERSGGKVLVKANVTEILANDGTVCGVKVACNGKSSPAVEIFAPVVVSSAGLYNTFQSLLPKDLSEKSYYTEISNNFIPGVGAMNVFLGLNKSAKELNVTANNMYAFSSNDLNAPNVYMSQTKEEAMNSETPLLYISFPSTKDPEWQNKSVSNSNKTTCQIVTLSNWEWFKNWDGSKHLKRGDEYDELKNSIGHKMIEQTCRHFPQISDCIDMTVIGTPMTNKHYLGHPHGEIYGLDHTMQRFSPNMVANLRPKTDIPGLYLTGQDVFSCGFTGAMISGAIAAQSILGRHVMVDLMKLNKKLSKTKQDRHI